MRYDTLSVSCDFEAQNLQLHDPRNSLKLVIQYDAHVHTEYIVLHDTV